LTGVDMVIIVTEPTVSGIHDLKRVFELTQHFEIPTFVCINKYDLNQEKTVEIEEYCTKQKIRTIGKIPFDRAFSESIIKAKPLVGWYSGESARRIKEMWEDAQKILWEEVR
jgi:MinD superfamily P-loop ATPase